MKLLKWIQECVLASLATQVCGYGNDRSQTRHNIWHVKHAASKSGE